jgi:hypothetical protein
MVTLSFDINFKEVLVVAYAIKDIMMIIKKNLRIINQVLNIPKFKLLIKSADTFAFKKNALGIAKKATKAIPISTNSIVPVTGEFKNLRPNTSQKVSIDKNKSIKPEAIAE